MPRKVDRLTTMPDPADDFYVHCRIKDIVEARGLSVSTAWRHVPGIGRNTITLLASGKTKGVDFDTLVRICTTFRCSIGELFEIRAVGEEDNDDTRRGRNVVDDPQAFTERINRLMHEKNATPSELADYLDASTSAVSRWLNGSRIPQAVMIEKMAKFFAVTVDALTVDVNEKNPLDEA